MGVGGERSTRLLARARRGRLEKGGIGSGGRYNQDVILAIEGRAQAKVEGEWE